MKQYIDRDDVIAAFRYAKPLLEQAEALPAADVVERKVGRWMPSTVIFPVKNTDGTHSNFGTLICSSCNKPVALVVWNSYCPNCGSDNREIDDEKA